MGELDRIADQVDQNLLQTVLIRMGQGEGIRDMIFQGHGFLADQGPGKGHDNFGDAPDIHGFGSDIQIMGFQFGEVEDIVHKICETASA